MSLRARLLLAFGVVAALLALTNVALARSVDSFLLSQVDARLQSAIPQVENRDHFKPTPGGGGHDDQPQPGLTDLYIQTCDQSGQVLDYVSPGLRSDDSPPQIDATTVLAHAAPNAPPFTVSSKDGSLAYRVRIEAQHDHQGFVVVALSLRDMTATSQRVLFTAGGVSLAVLLLLALVAWWVLRLGVRPLGRMATATEAIAAGDLTHRVEVTGGPRTEIGRLGTAFNTMLTEIEDAFSAREQSEDRLRRFVADASHELRTPLTSIRGYAELYRQGVLRGKRAMDDAMRRVEQEATRMGVMVEDLLVLTRLDQGRPLERAPVALDQILADAVSDAHAVEPERPITLESVPVTIEGDEHRLRQVAANLLVNVRVHTPPGTPAHVTLSVVDGWARWEVADEGQGIDPSVRIRVFERFFRADPSRDRRSGGAGLGLAIVAAIAEAHGGRVRVGDRPGGGASIVVEPPLVASAALGTIPAESPPP